MTNIDSILKSRDITSLTKICIVKGMIFPVVMYRYERWTLKKTECWCFQTVVLKTLESPLDSKEIKPVNPKGNWRWIFTGRTDAEGGSSNSLSTWCKELTHWKRTWCWGRLKAGEEGDRRWDSWMASLTQGHEFEQTPGNSEECRSLVPCSPWGHKNSDRTEWRNNNNNKKQD